jgi:hypothetical protein
LVELIDVEIIVVIKHKGFGEKVLEFRRYQADMLNLSALSCHLG